MECLCNTSWKENQWVPQDLSGSCKSIYNFYSAFQQWNKSHSKLMVIFSSPDIWQEPTSGISCYLVKKKTMRLLSQWVYSTYFEGVPNLCIPQQVRIWHTAALHKYCRKKWKRERRENKINGMIERKWQALGIPTAFIFF